MTFQLGARQQAHQCGANRATAKHQFWSSTCKARPDPTGHLGRIDFLSTTQPSGLRGLERPCWSSGGGQTTRRSGLRDLDMSVLRLRTDNPAIWTAGPGAPMSVLRRRTNNPAIWAASSASRAARTGLQKLKKHTSRNPETTFIYRN